MAFCLLLYSRFCQQICFFFFYEYEIIDLSSLVQYAKTIILRRGEIYVDIERMGTNFFFHGKEHETQTKFPCDKIMRSGFFMHTSIFFR